MPRVVGRPGLESITRALEAVPLTRSRMRAHLELLHLLAHGEPGVEQRLGEFLAREPGRRIRTALKSHGREPVAEYRFGPANRWFLAAYEFDDGLKSHSEIRLFELASIRFDPHGIRLPGNSVLRSWRHRQKPPLEDWLALADPSREPPHGLPAWILPDPGDLLAWSDDGSHLLTHPRADALKVWRLSEDRGSGPSPPRIPPSFSVPLRTPGVDAAAWSPDGRYMAIAGHDGPDAILELRRFRRSGEPAEGGGYVRRLPRTTFERLIFSRSGELLFSFEVDGRARVWQTGMAEGMTIPEIFAGPGTLEEVELSPDGKWMALRYGATVSLFRFTETDPKLVGLVDTHEVGESAFSPDSRWLGADGGHGSPARVWSLVPENSGSGVTKTPIRLDSNGRITSWSQDGRWLFVNSSRGKLLYDIGTRPLRPRILGASGGSAQDDWRNLEILGEDRYTRRHRLTVWRSTAEGGVEPVQRELLGSLVSFDRDGIRRSGDQRWIAIGAPGRSHELWLGDMAPKEKPRWTWLRLDRLGSFRHSDERPPAETRQALQAWSPSRREAASFEELLERTCRILGPGPTRHEWKFLFGEQPYAPACPRR